MDKKGTSILRGRTLPKLVPTQALPRGTVQVPIHSLPHPHVHTLGIKIKILYNHFPLHTLPVNTAAAADTL